MRIAITTKTGEMVDQHFGKADTFYIYDLLETGLTFVGKRHCSPYCKSSVQPDTNHSYSDENLKRIVEVISDCKVLYTQKIGDKPHEELRENGITIQICNCSVEYIFGCSCSCNCSH